VSSLVTAGTALDPYEYASDVVRGYCHRQFDFVANETVLLDPRPDRTAQLPQAPVTAITSVQAYMPGPPTGAWAWQTLTFPGQYGWRDRGLMWDASRIIPPLDPTLQTSLDWPIPTWPWLPGSLKVTYSHGFTAIPPEIQAIVQRLAAQIASNPSFLQSRRVGENSYVYGTFPGGVSLRDTDKAILDRYTVQEVS
jgi:hypothetical protein